MSKVRKALISALFLLALLGGILLGGAMYMVDYALCPPMNTPQQGEALIRKAYPEIIPWLDSLENRGALLDTAIVAPDGARLHARYVRAHVPTERTALIVHGYTDQAMEMMHIGYLYHRQLGCNILLPDLRYAGDTPGEAIQMGWKDREDVMAWMAAAPRLFGDSLQLVVHGISMGAATTMMTAGESLPAYVKCFVEDCGYTSVWDQFEKELGEQFGLPAFPLLYVASWVCHLKYGWTFQEASALRQVAKCQRPMLFVHGDEDGYVPTWMVYDLYAAKPGPKEMWVTQGVDHAHSYRVYPEEYAQRMRDFTQKYLK